MIESRIIEVGNINLPSTVPYMLYMHEINLDGTVIMPDGFEEWTDTIKQSIAPIQERDIKGRAFVTLDRKHIKTGDSHRRGGAHIDNIWYPDVKAHGGGRHGSTPLPGRHGGGWYGGIHNMSGSWENSRPISPDDKWDGNNDIYDFHNDKGGLLLVSDVSACEAWSGTFDGIPGLGGDCEHIRDQLKDGFLLKPNTMYLANSTCIHESLPVTHNITRTLMRISLPPVFVV